MKGKIAISLGVLLSQPKPRNQLYPGYVVCNSTSLSIKSELTVLGVLFKKKKNVNDSSNERIEENLVTVGFPQVIRPSASSEAP